MISSLEPLIKTPTPDNEKERLNALYNYAILDSLKEREFDRIAELAGLMCNTPISLIGLLDQDRQWFKSVIGFPAEDVSRDITFCQYTIMDKVILEVPDARKDERFRNNEFVTGEPGIRFYAGFPLIDPDGYALGSIAVADYEPGSLSDRQRKGLELLAEEVMEMIIAKRQQLELISIQHAHEKNLAELELNRSRKLLADILKTAVEVCIIATNTTGEITLFNTGAERLLGYTAEEVIGRETVSLFHVPEEIDQLQREFSTETGDWVEGFEVFSKRLDRKNFEQQEFTFVRKDGTQRKASLMGMPIRDAGQQITGYLGIAIDITETVRHREELQEARMTAEKASRAKSEFMANMSHEIRTPLNGIIGFIDLILKTELNETQQEYLSIVNRSADSLLNIVNDILDFAKMDAGKLRLSISRQDIYKIAEEAAGIMDHPVQEKGLQLIRTVATDLPRFIWADDIRLKQVLVNLLGNAAKFTEKGEIELKIECLAVSAEKSLIRFTVRDTGIGICAGEQDKIFEAFSQADSSVTKKYGGTGLGLTISSQLLELMGSRLQLKSTVGEGSTFYFDIAFRTEAGEAEPLLSDPSKGIKFAESRIAPLTILIAEDNPVNMLLTKTVVRRIFPNVSLVEAFNGLEALNFCKQSLPDMILMDIQMPDMNGYEATTRIRALEQNGHLPIIAVTASSMRSDLSRCYDAGMDDVITKPFSEESMASVISKWITDL